jgi:hypothetical protein
MAETVKLNIMYFNDYQIAGINMCVNTVVSSKRALPCQFFTIYRVSHF